MAGAETSRIHPKWMLASGNWLFRIRNSLFPVLFVVVAAFTRPAQFLDNPEWDRIVMFIGASLALAGQAFRLFVIGFAYIKRGGLNGKVYANDLVDAGLYAHTRNPMYVGNLFIAIGISIFYGSLWMYILVIPFFIWVHLAIMAAEEQYLLGKFGPAYEDYMKSVPRFFPDFRGITDSLSVPLPVAYRTRQGIRHGLRYAGGAHDHCNVGKILDLWLARTEPRDPGDHMAFNPLGLFYVVVRFLKKTRRLKEPADAAGTSR